MRGQGSPGGQVVITSPEGRPISGAEPTNTSVGVSYQTSDDGALLIVNGLHGSLVVFLVVLFLVLVYCLGVFVGIGVGQRRTQRPASTAATSRLGSGPGGSGGE